LLLVLLVLLLLAATASSAAPDVRPAADAVGGEVLLLGNGPASFIAASPGQEHQR
jgi:hypothetical protein